MGARCVIVFFALTLVEEMKIDTIFFFGKYRFSVDNIVFRYIKKKFSSIKTQFFDISKCRFSIHRNVGFIYIDFSIYQYRFSMCRTCDSSKNGFQCVVTRFALRPLTSLYSKRQVSTNGLR